MRLKIAENPDLSDVFLRGLADRKSLTDNDRNRFDQLMSVIVHACQQAYEFNELGIVSESVWEEQLVNLGWMAKNPGFVDYWQQWGAHRADGFREQVQKLLAEGRTTCS